MKKTLLSLLFLSSIGLSAQTTIFEDSFETYTDFAISNVGAWTLIDVDLNNPYFIGTTSFDNAAAVRSFMVFNTTTTTPPLLPSAEGDWTARTGNKSMNCMASQASPGPVAINNDWLISPQINLGTSGNVVSFWAKSVSTEYGNEKFKVGISAGNTTANVTLLSAGIITTPATATWAQYTYAVPASFNGQPVYFSINCVSEDQYGLSVDDFKVTAEVLGTDNFFKTNFAVYPNPATDVINISNTNQLEITSAAIVDVNGRTVKQINSAVQSINIGDLTAGVYFLKIATANGEGTTKIVKN
ncbi:T9SS-dependent choice-of-anchor J family protein [Flavobacterium antarcticum]|uniref:T9SS-dependent choice-of-anchor J family protein n=1 Tax=Flavobacterium antarcticum TaxID=271155 RepID=UPI0003B59460|nr:T9SS type A sorting domain-containing protein [Flavobacterium antarcticum]